MRPARTFGLSLAILASVMLFSLLPLMQVSMILLVRARMQTLSLDVPGEADAVLPMASGGSFTRRWGREFGSPNRARHRLLSDRRFRVAWTTQLDPFRDAGRGDRADRGHDFAECRVAVHQSRSRGRDRLRGSDHAGAAIGTIDLECSGCVLRRVVYESRSCPCLLSGLLS